MLHFTAAENNVVEPNLEKVQSFSRGSYRAGLRWVLKMIVNLHMFPDLCTSSHYSKIPIGLMNHFCVCCIKEGGRAASILLRVHLERNSLGNMLLIESPWMNGRLLILLLFLSILPSLQFWFTALVFHF